ncbi:MAG TPA: ABC transporter ATP-binding protein [Pyrinomonadaceae bacterium]|nr:ABC transporter ATP-binding protein [Pyrinomonadaceae bacterium]
MTNALEVIELEKRYRGFHLCVSFAVEEGRTLALLGSNGSGKTTILHALLNIVRRDAGEIRCFGLQLEQHEVRIKKEVGVFLEDPRHFEELRVSQLLNFYRSFYPRWDESYARALLAEMEIDPAKKFKTLSKGTKAKVALIVAFAPRPRLLILDEPTAGVDPKMRKLLVEKVREARARFAPAVLLTSHIMRDIEDLADDIAFLENGRIKRQHTRAEMEWWRVIEGTCAERLACMGENVRLQRNGQGQRFKLLTDARSGVLQQLQLDGAHVTASYQPDLEEVYDWVLDTPER